MFIVTTKNEAGEKFPLNRTTFMFSMDRAQKFESREAAEAALAKAKRFILPRVLKTAVFEIEEV